MFILLKYVMITIWKKHMLDKKAIKILNFFKATN